MIAGEIHEVPNAIQDEVDLMENYFGEGNIENEYDKIVSKIYDVKGNVIDHLPVYFYNMRNEQNQKLLGSSIECNDYVLYLEQNLVLETTKEVRSLK